MNQKLTELKEKTDNPTIMIGDFNTPLSISDRKLDRKSAMI